MSNWEQLQTIRDGGIVARFHTLRIRPQSVAEHALNVAEIILAVRPDAPRELIITALRHDVYEHITGDTPATAKWRWPPLRQELHLFEAHLNLHHALLPGLASKADGLLLKWADMFELVCYASEEIRRGNSYAQRLCETGLNALKEMLLAPDDAVAARQLLDQFMEAP